jgi:rSAM/selenodomain-associated transferase 1
MKAIVIMAREPEPNRVKTRLMPPLSPGDASRIYESFLLDKIENIKAIREVDRFVAYTPETSRNYFEGIIPSEFNLIAQKGKDLGERLANVSDSLFKNGYYGIMMMDSDTPNLPSSYIISGLEALDENDLVVGPCEDGGYYLIGLSRQIPEIFQGIPWSTPDVTKTTIMKAQSGGRSLSLLKKWYDVDTIEDLMRLKRDLDAAHDGSKTDLKCRNTHKILSEILRD